MKVGIMQGRLSPRHEGRYQSFPIHYWDIELHRARELGFRYVEFLYDGLSYALFDSKNWRECFFNCLKKSNLSSEVMCADYFVKKRLWDEYMFKNSQYINKLNKLIECCFHIGVRNLVLPFVDESGIYNNNDLTRLYKILESVIPTSHQYQVSLNLETNLEASQIRKLLKDIGSSFVNINYDTGNSFKNGFNFLDEFVAYGDRIKSVHIKDCDKQGNSRFLGQGDTPIKAILKSLKDINYDSTITLQCLRSDDYEDESYIVEDQLKYFNTLYYN